MEKYFIEALQELINDLGEADKIQLHNWYCQENNMYDDEIFRFDDIDELFSELKPTEILDKFSDVANCEYWYFNGYANATEADVDALIDTSNIIDYILESCEFGHISELENIVTLWENLENIKDDITELETELTTDAIIEIIETYADVSELDFIEELAEELKQS